MISAPKVRLESVECFERDFKLRLPFRFGVITLTEGTQAVIRATIALEDGRTSRRRRRREPRRQVVRQEPGLQRCAKSRPAASGSAYGDPSLSCGGREHAVRPLCRDLQEPIGAWRGPRAGTSGCLLRPGTARSGNPRCARAGDRAILRPDDHPQCRWARGAGRVDARSRGLRFGAFPGRAAAGPRHRRAAYGGAGRSHHGRRSSTRATASMTGCRKRWKRSFATTVRATTS